MHIQPAQSQTSQTTAGSDLDLCCLHISGIDPEESTGSKGRLKLDCIASQIDLCLHCWRILYVMQPFCMMQSFYEMKSYHTVDLSLAFQCSLKHNLS